MNADRLTTLLRGLVWGLNALGCLAYLIWLIREPEQRVFNTQEGVLYLLPVLPFAFVFLALLLRPPAQSEGRADPPAPHPHQPPAPRKPNE